MLAWKWNDDLMVGKGAAIQQFVATAGRLKFRIEVGPEGEGHLRIDGREVARIIDGRDRRQAFRKLAAAAERFKQRLPFETHSKGHAR